MWNYCLIGQYLKHSIDMPHASRLQWIYVMFHVIKVNHNKLLNKCLPLPVHLNCSNPNRNLSQTVLRSGSLNFRYQSTRHQKIEQSSLNLWLSMKVGHLMSHLLINHGKKKMYWHQYITVLLW